MAKIVGILNTSHVPAIGKAIHQNLQQDPYWKPFFDGFPPIRAWLDRVKPDIVVSCFNDHGLNFFLDKQPTFAIGAAPEYRSEDEGWGIPTMPSFPGAEDLSWHIRDRLIRDEFDMVTCQEMLVDHAFTLPMALLWPEQKWPVRSVPVCVNTVLFPLPSARRCYKLGEAIGRAIAAFPEDAKVLVIGSGGLSHQLEGERAGFINKEFDLKFMDSMVNDPQWATQFSDVDLVEQAGNEGVELLSWLIARGTVAGAVKVVHSNFHIPISNTAAATMLLEPV
ncbi:protocatechuate 3,4-dioxygenase [Duganella sp. LX20W]|uniref:Protocatechuate 3,4-dioxygenase n=1 Tax=Rugamonas brunnea TaxID=2758569 RepID=A0A7W2EVH1_9BURK|nr:class III extradiol dioxygenase family protein [Rugamonas brunnea]MBA5639349.1 protocatechuate 3,4-dioxygenase [Rugamonas brunnea]